MPDSPQLGFLFSQPENIRRIWTVHELVGALRAAVEREYADVFVEGEVSNYRPADSGHLYFTLKDGDSQLRVVMFRPHARLLRFRPENGLQVIARGRITLYEARGDLQLSAEYLEPKGAGALQIAFEQLKAKLAEEGLFEAARKRPLPAMPRRIGIVTSPRGAAIQDMLNILRRRHEGVHVLIHPAQVQGENAPAEVAAGVRYFNSPGAEKVDVIIVARGGGSAEDLAAFNDETLARTISASKIPTISAVGHETDFTIADFVADLRAPTPSAAAELVIESKHQLAERVANLSRRMRHAVEYQFSQARRRFTELAQHAAFARIRDLLNRRQQRVDDLTYRLADRQRLMLSQYRNRLDVSTARLRARDLRGILLAMHRELDAWRKRLATAGHQQLVHQQAGLEKLNARLAALSPLNILERGYALVFDPDGNLVKDPAQVRAGQELRARVARGEIKAVVK
ncbi:MAG: exodeoxyribonuclease VII large subunit [Acidobacteriales bacterium]|nr:exodeoxyribonuclease VII large subunit [Terriglobales bacterium]